MGVGYEIIRYNWMEDGLRDCYNHPEELMEQRAAGLKPAREWLQQEISERRQAEVEWNILGYF